jgi:uncharacterized protein (DUF305 family)
MFAPTPLARRLAAVGCAIALSATVSACGDSSNSSDGSPSDTQTAANGDVFNEADVRFATDMIPHHAQAIEMVTLTDGRQLDPDVARLASQIRDAQVPEVETMTDWLTAWGKEIPATSLDHSNAGHDMDDMDTDMPGMMSAAEMDALANSSEAEFQDLWLEMMMEHHQGALEMAKTERQDGKYADAVSLARSIEAAQQAEIEQIQQLLGA